MTIVSVMVMLTFFIWTPRHLSNLLGVDELHRLFSDFTSRICPLARGCGAFCMVSFHPSTLLMIGIDLLFLNRII